MIAMSLAATFTGEAQDAKAGAMLVTESGAHYVQGLDAWPEGIVGQQVVLQGELTQQDYVAEATQDADGAWTQGKTGGGPDSVLVMTSWETLTSKAAREHGVVEPGPWSLRYADGSGNSTRVWSDGELLQWSYDPVRPEQSSSGTYSGGEPAQGKGEPQDANLVWTLLRSLEADGSLHTDARAMGTGMVTISTPSGERSFLLQGGEHLVAFEAALDTLRQ
jgi:hypothetical protein